MHKILSALFVILALISHTTARPARASTIVNGSFTVGAGKYRYYRFNVAGDDPARILGKFRAEGGSNNDIQVSIVDEDEFENFKNGNNADTYYNKRGTVGTIDIYLKPGIYYLVFNNSYSLITNKAVTANVQMHTKH